MNNLIFDPVAPLWICVAFLISVAVVTLWKEHRTSTLSWFTLLAIFLVLAALAGILLRPAVARTSDQIIVLLTEGFDQNTADSVSKNRNTQIYASPGAAAFPNSIQLNSWQQLPFIAPLHTVIGEGIPAHALETIDNPAFKFLPSQERTGIVDLVIPANVVPDRECFIHGKFNAATPTKLILQAPDLTADSVVMEQGNHSFRMRFIPKTYGASTYQLIEKSIDGAVINEHTVPVMVDEPHGLEILMLLNSPSFEARYLKDILATRHRLTIRYELSRNVFRFETINDALPAAKIDPSSLKRIDLIITSAGTYAGLATREKQLIEKAIHDGLGILFIDESFAGNKFTALKTVTPKAIRQDTIHSPVLFGLAPININRVHIDPRPPVRPIVLHRTNVLAGFVNRRFGKVGFSIVKETYPLLLRGDSARFTDYWTPVIEQVARRKPRPVQCEVLSVFPYSTDKPIRFRMISREVPRLYYDSVRLPVLEDAVFDDIWYTTVWPRASGWNTMWLANDSSQHYFFVNTDNEFGSLRASQNARITSRYSTQNPNTSSTTSLELINNWYFYALFLVGAGILWVYPKLSGGLR